MPIATTENNTYNTTNTRERNPMPSVPVPPPRSPTMPSLPVFKAIYTFESQEESELSFQTGDIMKIIEKSDNGKNIGKSLLNVRLKVCIYRLVACSTQGSRRLGT